MLVEKLMTKEVITIPPDTSLAEAARKMLNEDVGSLPVCEQRRVVGIVTDRDIAVRGVARGLDPQTTKVKDIMTKDVYSCTPDSDVQEACELMEDRQIRRLIVVNGDGCCGIISLGDIALRLPEQESGEVLKQVSAQA